MSQMHTCGFVTADYDITLPGDCFTLLNIPGSLVLIYYTFEDMT